MSSLALVMRKVSLVTLRPANTKQNGVWCRIHFSPHTSLILVEVFFLIFFFYNQKVSLLLELPNLCFFSLEWWFTLYNFWNIFSFTVYQSKSPCWFWFRFLLFPINSFWSNTNSKNISFWWADNSLEDSNPYFGPQNLRRSTLFWSI